MEAETLFCPTNIINIVTEINNLKSATDISILPCKVIFYAPNLINSLIFFGSF